MSWSYRSEPEDRPLLEAAGLLDGDRVMQRSDLEPVKTVLPERQVHRGRFGNGEGFHLKRYFEIPFLAALRARLGDLVRPSRAARERAALLRLAALGIGAARPLVLAEDRRCGLVRRAYLVTESLRLGESLESGLLNGRLSADRRAILLRELADLLRRMHDGGLNHRDFYLGHLFLAAEGSGPGGILVLDLDRADLRREVARRWRAKDLAALAFSAPARLVTEFSRLRFLRLYCGEDLRRHRALLREIGGRLERMRRHVRRRIAEGRPNFHVND